MTRRKQAKPRAPATRRIAGVLEVVANGRGSDMARQRPGGIAADDIAIAYEQGLIEKKDELWNLSDAGRAWLRRSRAREAPFLSQHVTIERRTADVEGVRQAVNVNIAESPLSWLRHRKGRNGVPLISDLQFAAGERLRNDFTRARMMPSVTSSWSPVAHRVKRRSGEPGGAAALLDAAIAARTRVNMALAGVGPELADVLVDVCCFLKGLAEIEKTNGWPLRSGKLILKLALTRLARYYGMAQPPRATAGWQLRHWGDDDYRPTIDGT